MPRLRLALPVFAACILSTLPRLHAADSAVVTVTVDAGRVVRTLPRAAYSINAFHAFDPAVATNPAYQEAIAYLNPGMIRYHSTALIADSAQNPRGWLNHETRAWDVEKIRRATAAWPAATPRLFTLPRPPRWMTDPETRLVAADQIDAYASLCADLVRILNGELKLGILYWETLNEPELTYVRPLRRKNQSDQFRTAIELHNRAAAAMKRADPAIQVGGPAVSSAAWTEIVDRFSRGARDHLDFFSCHNYGSGNIADSDEKIYNAARSFAPRLRRVREILVANIPARRVPIYFDEFNIKWTWNPVEPRMATHKGAVFDALGLVASVNEDIDGTFAWNDVDNVYGKYSRSCEPRPSAHLYHYLNTHFIGDSLTTASSDEGAIVPFAVRQPVSGLRSLMLINRANEERRASVESEKWIPEAGLVEISAAGLRSLPSAASTLLTLPPHSVTLIIENAINHNTINHQSG
jgi:xylan 1,4-beta-xylosidase